MSKIKRSGVFPMFETITLLCALGAIGLLIALSVIDLKHWILPDKLNFALGITGVLFHFFSGYHFFPIQTIVLGAVTGSGLLYVIRFFSNRYYKCDTLGLGDVKLMGAAGLWLGLNGVLEAITIGAFAGLIHGLIYAVYLAWKNKTGFTLKNLSVPAGPGFAIGIIITGSTMFSPYIMETIHDILA